MKMILDATVTSFYTFSGIALFQQCNKTKATSFTKSNFFTTKNMID